MLNNPSIKTVGDSATSLKVTDLLFGFTLCEKKTKQKQKNKKTDEENCWPRSFAIIDY